ncbi:MAG: hypothetical protein QXO96_04945 [Sulfolobales archaeon]
MYIVNQEGFVVDPDTGEVIDDFSYRLDYTNFHNTTQYEALVIKRIERTATQAPKINSKKYLASLLPLRLREEFLSRVSETNDKAEVFAHFLVLCREYEIIFDFDKLREHLGISKISLRRARKEIMLKNKQRPWERIDRIFFEISDKIEKKYWLSALLLAIEYQRRGVKISVNEIKKHLEAKIPAKDNYSIFRLINGKNCLVLPYPAFAYLVCVHGITSKIEYLKSSNKFVVRHLGTGYRHDNCFVVSGKKVERILSKMELHYEAVKNAEENAVQLFEEYKQQ